MTTDECVRQQLVTLTELHQAEIRRLDRALAEARSTLRVQHAIALMHDRARERGAEPRPTVEGIAVADMADRIVWLEAEHDQLRARLADLADARDAACAIVDRLAHRDPADDTCVVCGVPLRSHSHARCKGLVDQLAKLRQVGTHTPSAAAPAPTLQGGPMPDLEIGDRVVVRCGDHANRRGRVLLVHGASDKIANALARFGFVGDKLPANARRLTAGEVRVALDGEPGQASTGNGRVARGGRGGEVLIFAIADLLREGAP